MRVALDTNVVSELAKPDCHEHVLSWVRQFRSAELLLPSPCWAEIRRGIGLLPEGRRRQDLSIRLAAMVDGMGGVLPFGRAEAEVYGELMSEPGRPRPPLDAMIVAVCKVNELPLATRNVRDFDGFGIDVVDPWAQPQRMR